jgi:L-asparaginase II
MMGTKPQGEAPQSKRGPSAPLIEIARNGLVESSHLASFALADSEGKLIASFGDPELQTFMRSSAKPFQAMPTLAAGAADAAGFTSEEVALMCASHAGTDRHAALAAGMLLKNGCSAEYLRCGVHLPYDPSTAEALIRKGLEPDALRNNCSGKHSGMLALAVHLDAPLDTYLEPDHPVQKMILENFSQMSGLPLDAIRVGTDGCSAPNFAIPLRNAAMAYARLMAPENLPAAAAEAARRVVAAMTGHPVLVSGEGRFDTRLMRASAGRLLSKGGAEGYQCVGIPADSLGYKHAALGLALKILDGDLGHRAGSVATLEVLGRIGALRREERTDLARFDARVLLNLAGLHTGEIRITPGFVLDSLDHGIHTA